MSSLSSLQPLAEVHETVLLLAASEQILFQKDRQEQDASARDRRVLTGLERLIRAWERRWPVSETEAQFSAGGGDPDALIPVLHTRLLMLATVARVASRNWPGAVGNRVQAIGRFAKQKCAPRAPNYVWVVTPVAIASLRLFW